MKLIAILTVVVAVGFGGMMLATSNAQEGKKKVLMHVVCFKYKEGTTPEQVKQIEDAFRALKTSIPGIVSFQHGTNNSPEKLNRGLTHCYILGFESEQARDAYLPHPEHKKFGGILRPHLDKDGVFVIDFWANE
jgi:hypothetical protein